MEKEFVPYEIALDMKSIGFNKPCFNYYDGNKNKNSINLGNEYVTKYMISDNFTIAPLYQQAFAFFRETYNLDGSMSVDVWNKKTTSYRITGGIKGIVEGNSYGALYDIDSKDYDTYEEAQIECLKQLIEIVKEKLVQPN